MARPKGANNPRRWTPSQVVAHNLTRARELRGLTQAEIAGRLSQFTGASWSATTVAQAEGSVSGNRVRQFTANELVALARTFDLPVLYFFLPPEDSTGELQTPDAPRRGWPWEYLLLLTWGHTGNFPHVADRAAPWAHASTVLVPQPDVLDPDPDHPSLAGSERSRNRFTPQDMLAVAFNGLARRNFRGSIVPGEELGVMILNLRRLADALETLNTSTPGAPFDTETLREMYAPDEPHSEEAQP